jgi:1,4-dihydroxy-2-naphthoate octaprenyltransferase
LTEFLQVKDGLYWDKYMALLRYVVVVATAIETWCKYPLLSDLCHVRYIFKVRQHENNESNNHNLQNVVENNSMWYTLDDLESSVNWKLTKRPITYH